MRHRRHKVRMGEDDRNAEEMRRMQCDLAAYALAFEQLLEQFLAAPLGVHNGMLGFQECFQRQPFGIAWVADAHEAGEVVREEPLLEEIVLHQVGEKSYREIDLSTLETTCDLLRRHRHRTDRTMLRDRTKAFDQARKKNDLAHIG